MWYNVRVLTFYWRLIMPEREDIGFKLRMLSNLIKRDVEKSRVKMGLNLPKGINGWAISYFFENREKDIFQRDFEIQFSIRRSTASNILKTMEQNGFIERISVESDARLKKIVLTEKAINIHKTVMKDIEKREARLRKNISNQEIEAFLKTLEKLSANMEENDD